MSRPRVGALASLVLAGSAHAVAEKPAPSLLAAAARQVEALPSAGWAPEGGHGPPSSGVSCCKSGCLDVPPPQGEACARSLGSEWSLVIGAAIGAGIGIGLGRDARGGSPGQEFEPFGLTDSLITGGAAFVALKGYQWVDRDPPPLCTGSAAACSGEVDALRGIDAKVRKSWVLPSWRGRARANSLSYVTAASALALPIAFLPATDQPAYGRELWLTVESAAITAAILQVVKHRENRPRPYAHYCRPTCDDDLSAREAQVSFFSGHSAMAFSFAVSAATIATMRGYGNAGWVLGSGLTLATATGYLRIAADRHYFTDVVTGAFVGALVGYAVPHLHGMRDVPDDNADAATRPAAPRPAVVLPIPLRGPAGGVWLHGGTGGGTSALALSWSF